MMVSDQAILDYIAANPGARREDIRRYAAPDASDATIWRALKRLLAADKLEVSGRGPATTYTLAGAAVVRAYLATPYNRRKPARYYKEFLDRYIPGKTFYLAEAERAKLREAGRPAAALPAGTYARRILERLLVDLSWASSRMEGNTYSILETERLIRFGQEASAIEPCSRTPAMPTSANLQPCGTLWLTVGFLAGALGRRGDQPVEWNPRPIRDPIGRFLTWI